IGWRLMFGSELIPALLFFVLLLFIPETPRYLALNNEYERAYNVLEKLNGSKQSAKEVLQEVKQSLNVQVEKVGLFYYGKLDLLIWLTIAILQQFIGITVILYYAPRIFESLGAGKSAAMTQTIFGTASGVVISLISIRLVDNKGRNFLLL